MAAAKIQKEGKALSSYKLQADGKSQSSSRTGLGQQGVILWNLQSI